MLKRKSLSNKPDKSMSMRNVDLKANPGLGEQQAADDLSI